MTRRRGVRQTLPPQHLLASAKPWPKLCQRKVGVSNSTSSQQESDALHEQHSYLHSYLAGQDALRHLAQKCCDNLGGTLDAMIAKRRGTTLIKAFTKLRNNPGCFQPTQEFRDSLPHSDQPFIKPPHTINENINQSTMSSTTNTPETGTSAASHETVPTASQGAPLKKKKAKKEFRDTPVPNEFFTDVQETRQLGDV